VTFPDNEHVIANDERVAADDERVAADDEHVDLRPRELPSSQIDVIVVRAYVALASSYVFVVVNGAEPSPGGEWRLRQPKGCAPLGGKVSSLPSEMQGQESMCGDAISALWRGTHSGAIGKG